MRRRLNFEWDEANRSHIARHEVSPEEAEEIISGEPLLIEAQTRGGEERFFCAGRTKAGRIITVVYTVRRGRLRVVTAFPAGRKLRRLL